MGNVQAGAWAVFQRVDVESGKVPSDDRGIVAGSGADAGSAPEPGAGGGASGPAWQVVDRALRGIAKRRAALDADEARWLRQAEALQIWKPLGMVSALDYMERALGYAPRTAQERLRVARALGALPKLDAAL